mmetsp:Transcript_13418/g.46771  ORF Transcript_13418/g.46771 Transcript_13418/m.46771 type:complete len:85 (+) Transcript_13418:1835-2089(+)
MQHIMQLIERRNSPPLPSFRPVSPCLLPLCPCFMLSLLSSLFSYLAAASDMMNCMLGTGDLRSSGSSLRRLLLACRWGPYALLP